jgi:preprotein translocase subunit SecG
MRKKLNRATIILAIAFIANAFVTAAYADEKFSSFDTALTSTTLSGGDIPWYNPGDSSDSSILTDSSALAPSAFSVSFSPSPVPEPTTMGLFAVGILILGIFAKAKRRLPHANQQTGDAVIGLR